MTARCAGSAGSFEGEIPAASCHLAVAGAQPSLVPSPLKGDTAPDTFGEQADPFGLSAAIGGNALHAAGLSCGFVTSRASAAALAACSLRVAGSSLARAALSGSSALTEDVSAAPSAALSGFFLPSAGANSGSDPLSAASLGLLARAGSRGGLWLNGGKRFAATLMLACAVQMALPPLPPCGGGAAGGCARPGASLGAGYALAAGNTYDNVTLPTPNPLDSGASWLSDHDTANNTTINGGGTQHISSGGTATATTINDGGKQIVSSGGTATSTNIYGGEQIVSSGGVATNTSMDSGWQRVFKGGVVKFTTIGAGGQQHILNDGTDSDATSTMVAGSTSPTAARPQPPPSTLAVYRTSPAAERPPPLPSTPAASNASLTAAWPTTPASMAACRPSPAEVRPTAPLSTTAAGSASSTAARQTPPPSTVVAGKTSSSVA